MPVAPPPPVAHDAAASRLDRAIVRAINAVLHYRKVGETLASMPRRASARRIVRAWLHSPSHRAVMLDPAYRRIGVSGQKGRMGSGRAFLVTADFSTWR